MRLVSPSVIRDAIDRLEPGAVRADSQGRGLSYAGILWAAYLGRADAAAQHAMSDVRRRHRLNLRADAHFLAGDLVDRASDFTVVPQRINALALSIPVRQVTPWSEYWTEVQVEDAPGMARPWRPGSTEAFGVDYSVSETVRPMIALRADIDEELGDAQRRQIAQSEAARAAGSAAEQMDRAIRAHLNAHDAALRSGIDGFGGYHLGNLPGALRPTTSATYNGVTSNADDALTEFRSLLDAIPEESEGTAPAPDTLTITRRAYNGLTGFTAFEAGGEAFSEAAIRTLLTGRGITSVVFDDRLKNFGGANKDGMILYSRASADSLRQVIGLAPAPVKTWDEGLARRTAVLSSLGGLSSRIGKATLITTLTVA